MKRTLLFLALLQQLSAFNQNNSIAIHNPSFEEKPKLSASPQGWTDLGFSGESAPDIHPNNFWGVNKKAFDGNTYVGMVARKNGTWERMGQTLPFPLLKDSCYQLSLYLSKTNEYLSGMMSRELGPSPFRSDSLYNFQTPLILKIIASDGSTRTEAINPKIQLLAQSTPIHHDEWKKYSFTFKVNKEYTYIILEAFYPEQTAVNGHILIDGMSKILPIHSCKN